RDGTPWQETDLGPIPARPLIMFMGQCSGGGAGFRKMPAALFLSSSQQLLFGCSRWVAHQGSFD
ncbi:MAG: hypothetical protein O2985_05280, partial [Proteobacteria bacterium]|nr:hypothetical protein [Pseudomonadota bacterium]